MTSWSLLMAVTPSANYKKILTISCKIFFFLQNNIQPFVNCLTQCLEIPVQTQIFDILKKKKSKKHTGT